MYKKIVKKRDNVYIKSENRSLSNLINSGVLSICTSDCFLNDFSSDQIAALKASAIAKYASSFGCGDKILAFDFINKETSSEVINCILSLSNDNACSNSEIETLPLLAISCLCFSNSCNKNSGANRFILSEKNNFNILPLPINTLNKIFASITNCIYNPINFLDASRLILFDNSFISLSDNLNLDENFSSIFNLITFSRNACLATSDQFISGTESISFFSSSGIDNVIFTILNTSLYKYVNYVQIYKSFDFGDFN